MEGNTYFLPLRNAKRYTPYEFDNMMSQNENRMDTLGKIIDQDIYNCLMKDRKTPDRNTPLVLTPKLILDNSKGINTLGPKLKSNNFVSQSQNTFRNPLKEVPNESFNIPQSPQYMNTMKRQRLINEENNIMNNNRNLPNRYEQFEPEQEINYRQFREPSNYGNEFRNSPRNLNNRNYYNRNDEPVKINDFNNEITNRNNDYPDRFYNNNNNNTLRSQDFSRSRSNYMGARRPTPFEEVNNNRNSYENNRYNNDNFDEGNNNRDFRNRSFKVQSPMRNDYNQGRNGQNIEDRKEDLNYVKRGFYNSQLNYPYDRYQE